MKINDLKKRYDEIEKITGINLNNVVQGSPEWHKIKLGVISASKADCLIAKTTTEKYKTYICTLVAEILTQEKPEVSAKALDWGISNEDASRSAFEFVTQKNIVDVPFIFGDETLRYGCSPDFLIHNNESYVQSAEIKTPYNSVNYVKFAAKGTIKREYELQVQFQLFVTGLDTSVFAQYDPRAKTNPFHWIIIERDLGMNGIFEDAIGCATSDMDEMLDKLGLKFGDQWGSK